MYSGVPQRMIQGQAQGSTTPARALCETCANCRSSLSVSAPTTPDLRHGVVIPVLHRAGYSGVPGHRAGAPQGTHAHSQATSPAISVYACQPPTVHARKAMQGSDLCERQPAGHEGWVRAGLPSPRFHADSFAPPVSTPLRAHASWEQRPQPAQPCGWSHCSPFVIRRQSVCRSDRHAFGVQPRVVEFRSFISKCSMASPRMPNVATPNAYRQAPPPPTRSPLIQMDAVRSAGHQETDETGLRRGLKIKVPPPPVFLNLPVPEASDQSLSDQSVCDDDLAGTCHDAQNSNAQNVGDEIQAPAEQGRIPMELRSSPPRTLALARVPGVGIHGKASFNDKQVKSPWRAAMMWRDALESVDHPRKHGPNTFFGGASGLQKLQFTINNEGAMLGIVCEASAQEQKPVATRNFTEMHDQATSYTPPPCPNFSDRPCPAGRVETGCNTSPFLFSQFDGNNGKLEGKTGAIELIVHESTTPAVRLYDPGLNFNPVPVIFPPSEVGNSFEEPSLVRHIAFDKSAEVSEANQKQPDFSRTVGGLGEGGETSVCPTVASPRSAEGSLNDESIPHSHLDSGKLPGHQQSREHSPCLAERQHSSKAARSFSVTRTIRLPTPPGTPSPARSCQMPVPSILRSSHLTHTERIWVPCASAFADDGEETDRDSMVPVSQVSSFEPGVKFMPQMKAAATRLNQASVSSQTKGEDNKENCGGNGAGREDVLPIKARTIASKLGNGLGREQRSTPPPRKFSPRGVFSSRITDSLQGGSPARAMR